MSPFWRGFAAAVAIVATLGAVVLDKNVMGLCSLSQIGAPGAEAPALCFLEFWLNRYQTLIAALVALWAAVYAARPAWRQLQATERQLAVLFGDLQPDIGLDWEMQPDTDEGHLEPAILTIQNLNRRGLRVRRIQIIQPRGMHILVYANEKRELQLPANHPDGSTWDIECRISGRGVGDRPTPAATFFIQFLDGMDEARAGQEEPVMFLVEYDLLGTPGERHRTKVRGQIMRRKMIRRA